MSVGVTRSVRVPAGVPERIRAASGMNFSEFVRVVCDSFLKTAENNRKLQAATSAIADTVDGAVEQALESGNE